MIGNPKNWRQISKDILLIKEKNRYLDSSQIISKDPWVHTEFVLTMVCDYPTVEIQVNSSKSYIM